MLHRILDKRRIRISRSLSVLSPSPHVTRHKENSDLVNSPPTATEAPDSFQSFPYEYMSPMSPINSPHSAGLASPQTPSSSSNQQGNLSLNTSATSKVAEKGAKKEAKRVAKQKAHEEAMKNGPPVGGLIFDPTASAKTTIGPAAPMYPVTPRVAHFVAPGNDKRNDVAEPQSKWVLPRLLDYIVEHDIMIAPEDRIVARNHLKDRNTITTFLDQMVAAEHGGEIPSAEDISSAEAIAERNGSLIIKPLDWTKGDFMEVLGLSSKAKEVATRNVEWQDDGSGSKGKKVITPNMKWEDKRAPPPLIKGLDVGPSSPMAAAGKKIARNKTRQQEPTPFDLASGTETQMTMSEKVASKVAARSAKATAKGKGEETALEEIEEASDEAEREAESSTIQADNGSKSC